MIAVSRWRSARTARRSTSPRRRERTSTCSISNSYTPLAIAGLAISVVGGFLFLRYSLAKFLRFWLLRQVYEQRAESTKRRLHAT